jgi:hypothetical protein
MVTAQQRPDGALDISIFITGSGQAVTRALPCPAAPTPERETRSDRQPAAS